MLAMIHRLQFGATGHDNSEQAAASSAEEDTPGGAALDPGSIRSFLRMFHLLDDWDRKMQGEGTKQPLLDESEPLFDTQIQ